MESLSKKDNRIVFRVEMSDSLANAIRRYVGQIPVVAIDEVEISKNDSPLYDETVAHRLGLVPLKQNKKEAKLKLEVKGPGFVYSGDLKGDVEPVYDKMPITLLNDGQEVEIEVTTKAGIGSEHAKFSPGFITYRNVVEISLDKDVADKVSQVVKGVEIKSKSGKTVIVDNKEKEVYDICEGIAEKEGKEIDVDTTKEIVMSVESFGQIKTEDVFKEAVKILKKDLEEVAKKIK